MMGQGQRALSRKERKQLTRRRLINGAIELLRTEGVSAATTVRISSAAGIAQSSFYGHFSDRDACLEAVAEEIGRYVIEQVREHVARLDDGDLRESIHRVYTRVIDAFLGSPELSRIFLRHRGDSESPLGRRFGALVERARTELRTNLDRYDLDDAARARADVYADLLVNVTLGAVEGLLSGRLTDRDATIDALTTSSHATLVALLSDAGRRQHH